MDAEGLLHPEVAQGVVVDARLDHERLAELALPDGGYWARVPDPDGGCASLVVTFSTDEAALAGVEAARHAGADLVSTDVDGPRVDDDFVVSGGVL